MIKAIVTALSTLGYLSLALESLKYLKILREVIATDTRILDPEIAPIARKIHRERLGYFGIVGVVMLASSVETLVSYLAEVTK